MEEEVLNKDTLKIRALTESLANTVGTYENRIADMRVEATVSQSESERMIRDLTNEVRRLHEELEELRASQDVEEEEDSDTTD